VGEQIVENWHIAWPAISASLPQEVGVTTHEMENNILQAALGGELEIYFLYRGKYLLAIGSVTVVVDRISRVRNLQIYSLFSNTVLTIRDWMEALRLLRKLAITYLCENIIAQSNNPRVLQIVDAIGGENDWHFIKIGVI